MMHSDSIKELASAFHLAQSQMKHAEFNKTNPYFKNKYADLTAIINCIREPFALNGLSFMQHDEQIEGQLVVTTIIMHVSGEWMKSSIPLFVAASKSSEMQQLASAITYGKRYALASICGISSEEDNDGNSQEKETEVRPVTVVKQANKNLEDILFKLMESQSKSDYEPLAMKANEIRGSLSHPEFEQLRHTISLTKKRLGIES